jgi:hypothetical protein
MRINCRRSALFAALLSFCVSIRVAAQTASPKHTRYTVVDTGTFGGPNSTFQLLFRVINASGIAATAADLPQPDPDTPCFNPNRSSSRYAGFQ